jgi:hypothetical protein
VLFHSAISARHSRRGFQDYLRNLITRSGGHPLRLKSGDELLSQDARQAIADVIATPGRAVSNPLRGASQARRPPVYWQ